MPDRRDALCAAAELILAIENAARTSGSTDTVATVGMCDVFPGAVNSIPSRVRLSLDVRDTDLARRDSVMRAMDACVAGDFGAQACLDSNRDAERGCAGRLRPCGRRGAFSGVPRSTELKFLPMISRAYHDSLFISRIAPAAMLFIPCRNGYSHRPDEYASIEDIARGALVLAETLASLSPESRLESGSASAAGMIRRTSRRGSRRRVRDLIALLQKLLCLGCAGFRVIVNRAKRFAGGDSIGNFLVQR